MADVNVKDDDEKTALIHTEEYSKNKEVIEYLRNCEKSSLQVIIKENDLLLEIFKNKNKKNAKFVFKT